MAMQYLALTFVSCSCAVNPSTCLRQCAWFLSSKLPRDVWISSLQITKLKETEVDDYGNERLIVPVVYRLLR